MSGCGGNCACAKANQGKMADCAVLGQAVVLDDMGKCPCGKDALSCCHKEELATRENAAVDELCKSHGGKEVC